jgi:hypothetical protein
MTITAAGTRRGGFSERGVSTAAVGVSGNVGGVRSAETANFVERGNSGGGPMRRFDLGFGACLLTLSICLPLTISGAATAPHLSGNTWIAASVPSPTTSTNVIITGISCSSASFCVAVGTGRGPVIEQWNGQAWSLAALPPTSLLDSLVGVSCVSSSFCMAVGPPGSLDEALTEEWDGSTWSVIPNPVFDETDFTIDAVSCSSSSWCVAVGSLGSTVLVEQWNGTEWTVANAFPPAGNNTYELNSVDCLSSSYCVAVGDAHVNQEPVTFIETWNGAVWSVASSPSPSVSNAQTTSQNHLSGISCVSASFCVATGDYFAEPLGIQPLIETWDGSTWTVTPNPTQSPVVPVVLNGVDCVSASECTTVGQSSDESAWPNASKALAGHDSQVYVNQDTETLAEVWNGSTWTVEPTPNQGTNGTVFAAVSCVGASQCVAAGITDTGLPHNDAYILQAFIASTVASTQNAGGSGYQFVASDGGVFSFGSGDPFLGSLGGTHLNEPIVGMAATPGGDGYYLVAADGGVFSFGSAQFYGSTGGDRLNKPIVGMAVTPDGDGYWLVASDGGIFSFGDAMFYGSAGGTRLNAPIVGMARTTDGAGYWLVASDGGIFSYGDAAFYGSTGSLHLNKPIVGMAVTPDGAGYWLVASDGGVFNYGDAGFYGSAGSLHLNKPVVGMAATTDGAGYRLVASDGGVFNYGDAGFYGSAGSIALDAPIVGLAR